MVNVARTIKPPLEIDCIYNTANYITEINVGICICFKWVVLLSCNLYTQLAFSQILKKNDIFIVVEIFKKKFNSYEKVHPKCIHM